MGCRPVRPRRFLVLLSLCIIIIIIIQSLGLFTSYQRTVHITEEVDIYRPSFQLPHWHMQFLKNYKNPCWYDGTPSRSTLQCFPYVYILGMAKSGTTTLSQCLLYHQDIVSPPTKEMNFWDRSYNKGPMEYTRLFQEVSKQLYDSHVDWAGYLEYHPNITFDGTPFMVWKITKLPKAFFTLNPKTKLIITMRNPTDRLFSHYHHWAQRTNHTFSAEDFNTYTLKEMAVWKKCVKKETLKQCAVKHAKEEKNILWSLYYVYVKAWLDVFPPGQILCVKAEELYRNTTAVMKQVYHFLDLDPPLPHVLERLDQEAKNLLPPGYEYWTKRDPHVLNSDHNQTDSSQDLHNAKEKWKKYTTQMWPSTRLNLDSFYAPYNKLLADLVGHDKFLFKPPES